MIDLTRYVNAASINGDDAPHEVVEKLQRAIDKDGPLSEIALPHCVVADGPCKRGCTSALQCAALKNAAPQADTEARASVGSGSPAGAAPVASAEQARFSPDSVEAASYIYEDCRARGQDATEAMRKAIGRLIAAPIEMLLFCPRCEKPHVDEPNGGWTNPPHATHTCQFCGLLWRPSNVNTTGVAGIPAQEEKHVARIMASYPGARSSVAEKPIAWMRNEGGGAVFIDNKPDWYDDTWKPLYAAPRSEVEFRAEDQRLCREGFWLCATGENLDRLLADSQERLRLAMLFIEEWANYWAYGLEKPEGAIPTAEDDAKAESFGKRAADMVIDNRRFLATAPRSATALPEESTVEMQEAICDHMLGTLWRDWPNDVATRARSDAADAYKAVLACSDRGTA